MSPLPVSPQTAPETSGGSKESSALLQLVSQGDPQDSLLPLAPSHVVCRPGALRGLLRGATCSPYGLSWELASTTCGHLQPQQPSLPSVGMWGRGWWPPVHQELKWGEQWGVWLSPCLLSSLLKEDFPCRPLLLQEACLPGLASPLGCAGLPGSEAGIPREPACLRLLCFHPPPPPPECLHLGFSTLALSSGFPIH